MSKDDGLAPDGRSVSSQAAGWVPASDFLHRAVCEKCGHVELESRVTAFIDPWFLPSNCRKCGHIKDRHSIFMTNAGWEREFGRYMRKKRLLLRPSTWVSRPVWVDW